MSDNVSGMNPVAKMGFVPRGIYDNMAAYDFLDFVYYNGNTYVAKKLTVGNEPQENNEYWQIFAKGGIEDVGIRFKEATELQNIQSGEDTPTLFGKIKKWYSDFKTVAFSGDYNDLNNKPDAKDVGALPLTGGQMEGNIAFEEMEGDYKITGAKEIMLKSEGRFDANGGYISGFQDLFYNDFSYPVKNTTILTTKEQIDANTDADNVAGATAVKSIKSDLTNSINQINSKITNISTIISENTTLTVGQNIVTSVDARKYQYFIISINWRYTPITKKRYYNSTHDIVGAALVMCESDIASLRQVEFLINRSTGEITLNKWNQANLQSDATWYISNISDQGVGLFGIF